MTHQKLQEKIEELENAAAYLLKISGELKTLISGPTKGPKRKLTDAFAAEVRAKFRAKYGPKANKK